MSPVSATTTVYFLSCSRAEDILDGLRCEILAPRAREARAHILPPAPACGNPRKAGELPRLLGGRPPSARVRAAGAAAPRPSACLRSAPPTCRTRVSSG